jgi:hypothetical protein
MARSRAYTTAFLLLLLASAVASAPAARATGDPVVLNASAPIAAQQLERLYRKIRPAFWQNANAIPQMPAGSGDAYELTASVEGRVGCGGPDMLILKMNGASVYALIPRSFQPDWLNDGQPLRLIVRDNVQPEDSSEPGYLVLAAAPEVEVAAIENASAPHPRQSRSAGSRSYFASDVTTSRFSWSRLPAGYPAGHPIVPLTPAIESIYPWYRHAVLDFNPRLSSLMADTITTSVLLYSEHYRLDPRLVMAMIVAESGFDPNSYSSAGAIGIGQLMPGTAAGLGVNPYDPIQNVGAAVEILSTRVNQYGGEDSHGLVPLNTLALTMAAYNAGPGAVQKYHGIPPYTETQNYVRKVAGLYRVMCGG